MLYSHREITRRLFLITIQIDELYAPENARDFRRTSDCQRFVRALPLIMISFYRFKSRVQVSREGQFTWTEMSVGNIRM